MARKHVWAVSSGEYSDYRVLAICDSKKRAEAIAAQDESGYGSAFVEKIPYWDTDPRVRTVYGRECVITKAGEVKDEQVRDRDEHEVYALWTSRMVPSTVRWVRAPMYDGKAGRLEVYGTSKTRVLKAYSEHIARIVSDPTIWAKREWTP